MVLLIVIFVVATGVVAVIGPRLARVAEAISNRLELGEVLVGAVLLGVVTSLPGLVLTITAAARGETELAVSNAIGGVAAQTLFLGIADVVFRKGTLSAYVPTRQVAYQAALLMVLLAIVTVGLGSPGVVLGWIHPVTPAIACAYGAGLFLSRRLDVRGATAIGPEPDADDVEGGRGGLRGKLGELQDSPEVEAEEQRPWSQLWLRFGAFALTLGLSGFALAWAGSELAATTALSAGAVGVTLTSVATSTPELVTAVAAARRGAIGLAAGDIIGGNTFDTLFVAAADLFSGGSVFAGAGSHAVGLVGLAVLLNGVLLAGVVRQGSGAHDTDIESWAIIVIWIAAVVAILV